MWTAVEKNNSPYWHVVSCLADILQHVWGDGEELIDGSESNHPDGYALPDGVDLLHAFPVAGVDLGCGSGGCGDGGCGSHETPSDLVQLSSFDGSAERSGDS